MEFARLILDTIAIFGTPLLVLILIILSIGKLLNNEKSKKIALFIFSLIYNAVVGHMVFLLLFWLIFLLDAKMVFAVCIFAIILIPINIYMMRKVKINPILYIIFNIIIFVLSAI